ncbi:MAG: group I intron-associated PD-(D/E)XK endonuclease [Mycobacteriales bacterium]
MLRRSYQPNPAFAALPASVFSGQPRKCLECKKPLSNARRSNRRYCSAGCRDKNPECLRYGRRLTSATTGAIHELEVSCDLLKKGYEVFRALSPSCSCDLAILKDGRLLRIEVRTGHLLKSGKLSYARDRTDEGRQDHFAVVYGGGIRYEPTLEPAA